MITKSPFSRSIYYQIKMNKLLIAAFAVLAFMLIHPQMSAAKSQQFDYHLAFR